LEYKLFKRPNKANLLIALIQWPVSQMKMTFSCEFLQKLVKDRKIHEARAFNFTYRYIDDVLSINNSRFADFLPLIYPPELEVKETTDTASSASFLDLYLEFDDSGQRRRPAETVSLQRRQICYR
jgi:hypothetical protein